MHDTNNNTKFIHRRMSNLIWLPVAGIDRGQVVRHGSLNNYPRTTTASTQICHILTVVRCANEPAVDSTCFGPMCGHQIEIVVGLWCIYVILCKSWTCFIFHLYCHRWKRLTDYRALHPWDATLCSNHSHFVSEGELLSVYHTDTKYQYMYPIQANIAQTCVMGNLIIYNSHPHPCDYVI